MECNDVFQVLKENNCQPSFLYPISLSFKNEAINTFQDKQKLRKFMATSPALPKMLKEVIHPVMKER
jgi:hypothetical protein